MSSIPRAVLLAFILAACGSGEPVRTQEPTTLLAPPRSSAPAATSAPPPPPPPTPAPAPKAPKGKFLSLALSPKSGKIDKIGAKDGAFTPDGINDLVLDAEIEGGPVIALIVATTDGKFGADTFVGMQLPPSEADAEIKPGVGTVGVGVFENDKLLNAPDGSLPPLSEGNHKLTLYVSWRDIPRKATFKVIAVLDDRSMVASPLVSSK